MDSGNNLHVGCLYKLLAYAMMLLTSIRFTPTYLCAKRTNHICTYVLGYIQQCVQFVITDVVNAIMFAVHRIPYIARLCKVPKHDAERYQVIHAALIIYLTDLLYVDYVRSVWLFVSLCMCAQDNSKGSSWLGIIATG